MEQVRFIALELRDLLTFFKVFVANSACLLLGHRPRVERRSLQFVYHLGDLTLSFELAISLHRIPYNAVDDRAAAYYEAEEQENEEAEEEEDDHEHEVDRRVRIVLAIIVVTKEYDPAPYEEHREQYEEDKENDYCVPHNRISVTPYNPQFVQE